MAGNLPVDRLGTNGKASTPRAKAPRTRVRRVDREELLELAGTVPDHVLAKRLGCTRVWVTRLRRAAGIPRYDRLAEYLPLLGYSSDAEVAELAGVQARTVRERRERLGIGVATYTRSPFSPGG